MKYLKKFEKYDASLDLNHILNDEVFEDSHAMELLNKVKYAIDNDCVIDNINTTWINRTPLILCSILSCHIQKSTSKYIHIYAQIAKKLLDAGANIDYVDSDKKSALIWSSEREHFDVMKLLIEEGANWNIIDVYMHDFFDYLTAKQQQDIMNKYPEQYKEYIMKKTATKFNV